MSSVCCLDEMGDGGMAALVAFWWMPRAGSRYSRWERHTCAYGHRRSGSFSFTCDTCPIHIHTQVSHKHTLEHARHLSQNVETQINPWEFFWYLLPL
jgi:hypothetical protein